MSDAPTVDPNEVRLENLKPRPVHVTRASASVVARAPAPARRPVAA